MFESLEIPKETTKLLVNISNEKWLRYFFGQHGIYIESVKPLITQGTQINKPTIITIRFDSNEDLKYALKVINDDIYTRRIFKSEIIPLKMKDKVDKFIYNCAKNLLHLAEGSSIKIRCKDNRGLQKRFYDIFVKVNEEENTNCTFDYDNYTVEFLIKEYMIKDRYCMITFADGLDDKL
jgi:hypothetical protein